MLKWVYTACFYLDAGVVRLCEIMAGMILEKDHARIASLRGPTPSLARKRLRVYVVSPPCNCMTCAMFFFNAR